MKVNKHNKILLFILLFVLTILIRYPIIPHELGTDNFVNHMTINFISEEGGPVWVPHFLMLFGFGDMFNTEILISGISQLTGLDVERSIFYYSLIIGLIGIIGFYILIYLVTKDFSIAYISSLLFTISPEFIRETIWTITTRSLLMVLIPFCLYFIFRSINNKDDLKNYPFIIIFLIFLMGTHNLVFLVFIMIFAIFLTIVISRFKVVISINDKQLNMLYLFILSILTSLSAILFRVGPYDSRQNLWIKFTEGSLFSGQDAMTIFLNMSINYMNKIGFPLFIAFFGIIYLFKKNKSTIFDKFCLILILMMSPLLGVGIYTPLILMLPLLYLISLGLMEINKYLNFNLYMNRFKIPKNVIISFIIIFSVIFSIGMNFHWEMWKTESVDSIQYSKKTSDFIKEYGNGTYIPNERSFAYRWTAYSGVLFKPYKKPEKNMDQYVPFFKFDMDAIESGKPLSMVQYKRISENINGSKNSEDDISGDFWYEVTEIWNNNTNSMRSYFEKNQVKYSIKTKIIPYSNEYIDTMPFFVDINSNKGKIFDTRIEEVWYI